MEKPLAGRTVAVTRARKQARELVRRLESRGARVEAIPLIRTVGCLSKRASEDLVSGLDRYEWIVFTSSNAVRYLLGEPGEPIASAGPAGGGSKRPKLAAVGRGTAESLRGHGLDADWVAKAALAETLAEELAAQEVRGMQILFPCARAAREVLPDRLKAAGAAVERVELYETVADDEGMERLDQALTGGELDVATLASPSTVERYHQVWSRLKEEGPLLVSIGPVTTKRATRLGLQVAETASEHSLEGLVAAVELALTGRSES